MAAYSDEQALDIKERWDDVSLFQNQTQWSRYFHESHAGATVQWHELLKQN